MKLRIRQNSIRLRLGKSEVDRLEQGIECREAVCFPGNQKLEYVLEPSPKEAIAASLSEHVIRVEVPARDLLDWCVSDRVGLSAEILMAEETALQILIEKDFRCLDAQVSEDQSDTFENPLDKHTTCEPRA
jgi:hypothetical protein